MPKIYAISKTDNAVEISPREVELRGLPEIAGRKNVGVRTGLLHQGIKTEIRVLKTVIDPNGYLAPHASAGTACLLIVRGSGEMVNVDDAGKMINKVDFGVGDVLIFTAPMPWHYYRAGPDGAEYIAITSPQDC
jgi:hypothetical protein